MTIIKPHQKTYKDYGLPNVEDYPQTLDDNMPSMLPEASSTGEALRRIARVLLGNQNYRLIDTPLEPALIIKERLRHVIRKREQARERYSNFILPTLTAPNEIWLTSYEDGFRRRFIKLFRGKHMLVVVRENISGGVFWNAILSKHRYINNQRVGMLLYECGQPHIQAPNN